MIRTIRADGHTEWQYLDELRERQQATDDTVVRTVQDILQAVRRQGDAAVQRYSAQFDGLSGAVQQLGRAEMEAALGRIEPTLRTAMQHAADNIRRFHKRQLQQGFVDFLEDGSWMGQKVRPLRRVGLYVPGGRAAYPSSVLMNAIPAQIAGVEELNMVTPPAEDGRPADNILAAAAIGGVSRIICAGGAQAVAALAYGTETIPQVDKIVGPGNIYVATAKRLVFGTVDIDMIAGPSEILIVADGNARADYIAADLMSQCEHDPMAGGILLCDDAGLSERVQAEINRQLAGLSRADTIREALAAYGVIVVFDELTAAMAYADAVAPEHLELLMAAPETWLGYVNNAGSVFLGPWTPEPVGDYYAGANHVLPTGGTARFSSPLGVDAFLKRMSFTAYSEKALRTHSADIICFAEAEGLTAHANAVKVRISDAD